ncbi:Rha family transcriptional regulator [Fusobacterium ulcerans]|uniref:Rha family transcriptional regulator n=1 Tax=Fusobacterium ulcerans TaxID=861 RepID=UPI00102FB433|nr:Rha family transcriptional regulator [Fusobacterium ulcerans]
MNEILNLNLEFDEKIGYYVSSRTLADGLGKRHKNVLESIDNIKENSRAEISALLIEGKYKAKNGKMNREYKLTKDGFTLYMFHVQGFTEFKMAYINRFNEMENFIKQSHDNLEQIKVNKKFDWLIKRVRDRTDRAEHIENMISYLFELLETEYKKIVDDISYKTVFVVERFKDFKDPEQYDATKEELPSLVLEKNNDGSIEIKVK